MYLNFRAAIFLFLISLLISCKKESIDFTGQIEGPTDICINATGIEFSINTAEPLDYILWSVPEEATIVSGQGTTKIIVDFGTKPA